MSEPENFDEYTALFYANTVIDGYGIDVTNHLPCPWCAHPDFMLLMPAAGIVPNDKRPNLDRVMSTEHTCSNCGRSGKNLISRGPNGVNYEFVQTGGAPPPDWLVPQPRRVE